MNLNNSFLDTVKEGLNGSFVGLFDGLPKMDRYTNGVQKGRYYLIGGDSSVGKTTFADFMILNLWEDAKNRNIPIKIFYYSLEISKADKIAKWISYFIFKNHKIEINPNRILGRVKDKFLTKDEYKLVEDTYNSMQEIFSCMEIIDNTCNPTSVWEHMIRYYESTGNLQREDNNNRYSKMLYYTPNDTNAITVVVIDHIGLLANEKNTITLKDIIDKMSKYFIVLKNIFNTTVIAVQQFSTDLLQARRQQVLQMTPNKRVLAITPTRLDFGDSKATYRDAEVVIGLTKPSQFDIDVVMGMNCSPDGLGSNLTLSYIMKNRYGQSGKILSLFMYATVNTIYEIDKDHSDNYYELTKKINNG